MGIEIKSSIQETFAHAWTNYLASHVYVKEGGTWSDKEKKYKKLFILAVLHQNYQLEYINEIENIAKQKRSNNYNSTCLSILEPMWTISNRSDKVPASSDEAQETIQSTRTHKMNRFQGDFIECAHSCLYKLIASLSLVFHIHDHHQIILNNYYGA